MLSDQRGSEDSPARSGCPPLPLWHRVFDEEPLAVVNCCMQLMHEQRIVLPRQR